MFVDVTCVFFVFSSAMVDLRNRGHLSSYMAGLAPELYRDTLTDFIVRNNPKK